MTQLADEIDDHPKGCGAHRGFACDCDNLPLVANVINCIQDWLMSRDYPAGSWEKEFAEELIIIAQKPLKGRVHAALRTKDEAIKLFDRWDRGGSVTGSEIRAFLAAHGGTNEG